MKSYKISYIQSNPIFAATFLAIFLLASCTNIYAPLDVEKKPSEIKTYEAALSEGTAAMKGKDYESALLYFDRAIILKPSGSEARLLASTSIFLSSQSLFIEAVALLMGDNIFANLNTLFQSRLFTEGVLARVLDYLNDPTHSIVLGKGDQIIPPSSLSANLNLLTTEILLLPWYLLDSNKNQIANENSVGGDLLYLGGGAPAINTNFLNLAAITNSLSSLTTTVANLATANISDATNPDFATNFYAIDNQLKSLHDETIEPMLLTLSGILIFDSLSSIENCMRRMLSPFNDTNNNAVIDSLSFLNDSTSFVNSALSNLGPLTSILKGGAFNSLHSNLNGQWAFSGEAVPRSYTITPWISFTNENNPCKYNDNLQHSLLTIYIQYTNFLSLSGPVAIANGYSNLINSMGGLTNEFANLPNILGSLGSFGAP